MSADPTRIDIDFDPTVQRMRGIAVHGNTPFDVPYVSEIGHNLWQGGCTNGLILPKFIHHLVSLYPWERYRTDNTRSELYVTMYDSVDQRTDQVDRIARWVNECRADGPTLIHCQAGLNRSSLVAARAIHLETGSDGELIVEHLRALRSPAVLCNPAFEREVRSWGATTKSCGQCVDGVIDEGADGLRHCKNHRN